MSNEPKGKFILVICIAAIAAIICYTVLNAPDRRSAGQKVSDAVNELPNGVDKASRQLEDRTPGQKLSDAAKDTSDDIKKSTNQQ